MGFWGQNSGRWCDIDPLTNSFFLLGVLTSVPFLVKIHQEMLYAIAMGQIIILPHFHFRSIWPNNLDPHWDDFRQVWSRSTYPFLTYNVLLLIRYVTLWPWPLTLWSSNSSIVYHVIKLCTKFERNRTIQSTAKSL